MYLLSRNSGRDIPSEKNKGNESKVIFFHENNFQKIIYIHSFSEKVDDVTLNK